MAGPPPTSSQLRPALQLALEVASGATGPLPGRVRSVVRSRRLPANWQSVLRQAVDRDEGFRAEVAEQADEAQLGRSAWLWLVRPEGWEEELEGLVRAALDTDEQERQARAAAGRITELEEELDRVVGAHRSELEAAAEEHEREVSVLNDRVRTARAEARRASQDTAAARRRAADAEEDNAALRGRVAELLRTVDGLRSQVADMDAALSGSARAAELAEADRSELERRREAAEQQAAELRRSVGGALSRAAGAARLLSDALAEASASVGTAAPDPGSGEPPPGPAAGAGRPAVGKGRPAVGTDRPAAGSDRRGPAPAGPVRRRPVPLPPAVFDDSPEAADHLVRVAGIHLIVDGYNVTFTSWTGDDLPALRHRLVSALSELAVRVKQRIVVVFDGADQGGRAAAPPVARPWLTVLFSASSVEADQVIVDAVDGLGPAVPVVVATNDRRVRDDVRRRGANVLSVEQLLSVLGRQPAG